MLAAARAAVRPDDDPPPGVRDDGRVDRVRPAQPHLLAPAAAVVLVLRPQPDRPADEPRDGRRRHRADLPLLRAAVLHAVHPHHRRRADRAADHRPAAVAGRGRDRAAHRLHRDPLLARLAPGADRGAADARRRHHAGRGGRRRRPRREGVRPGGARDPAVPRQVRAHLRRERARQRAARRVRAAARVRARAGRRRRARPRRLDGRRRPHHARRLRALQPAARAC